MKGFDHIFCASQASTAVCSSRDQIGKCTITTTATAGGRAIDRHNPTTKDGRRSFSTPCSSSSLQTIDPKPVYHQLQKTQKPQGDSGNCREAKKEEKSRKQSEPERNSSSATSSLFKRLNNDGSFGRKSFSCTKPVAIGSSRYLLGEPENDAPGLPVGEKHDAESVTASKPDASLSSTLETIKPSSDQVVVVLRVSLHCRGCEGKVRKHLSRMQGVTSFNIDFAAKKVTVTGDFSPLEVLASISKVKNAQLWTNPPSSSSSSSTLSTRLSQGIKN